MTWGATEAKAKFSEVLDRAVADGPQLVRRRKRQFVLLTEEEYASRTRPDARAVPAAQKQESLAEFFRNSPLAKYGVKIERLRSKPRRVSL